MNKQVIQLNKITQFEYKNNLDIQKQLVFIEKSRNNELIIQNVQEKLIYYC